MPETTNQAKDTQATEGAESSEQTQSQEVESPETLESTQEEPTDWGAFDAGFDGDDSSSDGDVPATAETKVATESETAETQETPTPAPATTTETTPETPASETEQQTSREYTTTAATEVDIDTQWASREEALATHHQIDEATANAILDNPQEHLPKLLAKVQVTAERTIWENLHQVLPDTVRNVLDTQQTEQQVQDAFFDNWPKLKEHVNANPGSAQVIQNLRTTFDAQPGADKLSQEDKIHQVGAAAMVALGIPFDDGQPSKSKNLPAGAQEVKGGQSPKTRQSAGKNASSPGGKKLGAFEEFDAELGGDGVSSRGATLY